MIGQIGKTKRKDFVEMMDNFFFDLYTELERLDSRVDSEHQSQTFEWGHAYNDIYNLACIMGELVSTLNNMGILNKDQAEEFSDELEHVKTDVPSGGYEND